MRPPEERESVAAGPESSEPSRGAARERSTRPFQAVQDELARGGDFRSAQDIHAALRSNGAKVALATVYRALQTLVEAGSADVLRTEAGEAAYRACGSAHHHHLVCRACGRTIEVSGPAFETWADDIAQRHGFSQVDHTLELFGTCSSCQRPEV